ncbi:plastocyanin/azurin family copper-binding protein [Labrenzia sp. PHM005]|uniref:cupredoxin domain-containing protein n=1 Tax=Labrenzia sp. PHM005 TaxID=2590016 RepID=UPI001140410C|nr:plastocyanin/azurin family copper-binding protein [Labrenzia sp. PHM005]QDG79329.1 copper-binding protein [Labrenzia sp. PHM005]
MFPGIRQLPLALLAVLSVPAVSVADEAAELCAKAEERYVDIFGQPSSAADGVTVVTMYKYRFCPEKLTVPVGTTVRWVNVDKRTSHSVHLKEAGEPESDRLFPEEAFEFTFLSAGSQQYLCGPHWETQEMIGMVTVTD